MSHQLTSLRIRNYRALEQLDVPSLARVNLILGQNNVGKSSLLEALYLYATRGVGLKNIFTLRGDEIPTFDVSESDILAKYASLFTTRANEPIPRSSIAISEMEETPAKRFLLSIERYTVEETHDENGVSRETRLAGIDEEIPLNQEQGYGLFMSTTKTGITQLIPFFQTSLSTFGRKVNLDTCCFVSSSHLLLTEQPTPTPLSTLWQKIALTPNEETVVQALSIIEPIKRIAFVDSNGAFGERFLVQNALGQRVPIKNMGDGVNRIFTLALSLVHAQNGFLFVDEFDNGLHYSVQAKLWEMILVMSENLNIQVFATTHSNDCIAALTEVLQQEKHSESGAIFRLQRTSSGKHIAVKFVSSELNTAREHGIEIR